MNKQPQELNYGRRTTLVAAALLLLTASFILVKTGRDALYFQGRGLFDLPYAYLGMSIASAPIAMFTLELMRRLGPRAARLILPVISALLLMGYVPFASTGGGLLNTLFFLLVPAFWGVLFSLSWLLAGDLLEGAGASETRRAYSRLGAASLLGGILGALLAKALCNTLQPVSLIALGALALVLTAAIMAATQRCFASPKIPSSAIPSGEKQELKIGLPEYKDVFSNPYSSMLFAIASAAALSGVLVEFQFYLAAAASGNTGQENANFFANFYLALNGGALIVQLAVMPRLQRRIGVHGSLLALPFALLGGAAALVLAGTSIGLRSGLRVAEGGIKSSIHRANWEQAYLPLGRARRAVAKIIIDGMGARSGEMIAAAALFAWLQIRVRGESVVGLNVDWVSWALGIAALTWLVLTRLLGRRLQQHCVAEGYEPAEYSAAIPMPDT